MLDTWQTRAVALAVLVSMLFVACVGFGMLSPNPQAGRYPGSADIAPTPETYVGDSVVVKGTVVDTDPLLVKSPYTTVQNGAFVEGTYRVTVTDTAPIPTRGDTLQIFGTLTDEQTISASQTVLVPAQNYLYMYGISLVAGVWVLLRLLRRWRVDCRRLRLVPRASPLALHTEITAGLTQSDREDDDA